MNTLIIQEVVLDNNLNVTEIISTKTLVVNPIAVGIPIGGTTGQVLAKASDENYDTEWVNQSGGGGTPGGADTSIQYNNAGAFDGFGTYDGTYLELPIGKAFKGQYQNLNSSAYINPNGSAVFSDGDVVIDVDGNLTTNTIIKSGGTSTEILMADGSIINESTKEDSVNKSSSIGDIASSVKFPVWVAVVSYVTGLGYLLASTADSTFATIANLALKADKVTITGATKTKVTYNSQGIVTNGADATTADIADSTNKRYQTDAQNTYNDATSSIQTQLNAKQGTVAKKTVDSTGLNVNVLTILEPILIPANTFSTGSIMEIENAFRKVGTSSSFQSYYYINTTNTLTGATLIATNANMAASSLTGINLRRSFNFRTGNVLDGYAPNTAASYENVTSVNARLSTTANPANDLYIFIAILPNNNVDTIYNAWYTVKSY